MHHTAAVLAMDKMVTMDSLAVSYDDSYVSMQMCLPFGA